MKKKLYFAIGSNPHNIRKANYEYGIVKERFTMQDEIKEARLRDYRKWATPSVVNILKGVEKMCLDYKRAREIPLTVNDEGMSYTDGKRIVVSLMHSFLDPKYSETYWMVVMKASTAHECQHVNSSSIKRAKKWREISELL